MKSGIRYISFAAAVLMLLSLLAFSSCSPSGEAVITTDDSASVISEGAALALLYSKLGTSDPDTGRAYLFYITEYRVKIDERLYYYGIWELAIYNERGTIIDYEEKTGVFVADNGTVFYTGSYDNETKKTQLITKQVWA